MHNKEIDNYLACTICLEKFSDDTVCNEHGHSYHRECIEKTYKSNNNKDPQTANKCKPEKLIPNLLLQQIAKKYKTRDLKLDDTQNIPKVFICALSKKLMERPVIISEDITIFPQTLSSDKKLQLKKGETYDYCSINYDGVHFYENFVIKSLIGTYTNLVFNSSEIKGDSKMQKLFSEDFITAQRDVFEKHSRKAGELSGLINAKEVTEVLNYMAKIQTPEKEYTCVELLKLIENKTKDFSEKYKSASNHPYYMALQEIKKNVINSINFSHPTVKEGIQKETIKEQTNKNNAYRKATKDVLGMITCGIWLPFQKVLSFGDCCGDGSCHSDCCNPVRTIKHLKADFDQQKIIINDAEDNLVPLRMIK